MEMWADLKCGHEVVFFSWQENRRSNDNYTIPTSPTCRNCRQFHYRQSRVIEHSEMQTYGNLIASKKRFDVSNGIACTSEI
jgi:hypothetical protein